MNRSLPACRIVLGDLVIGIISLAGRIIPAFNQNWLRLNRPQIAIQLPPFERFDLASAWLTIAFAVRIGWSFPCCA